jgi:ABC-type glycerol-3-phosphate transport system permease component
MVQDTSWGSRLVSWFSHVLLLLFTVACLIPVWIMVVASFTHNATLQVDGYLPWARRWSLEAYRFVFAGSEIRTAYQVTVFVTVVGTVCSLVIMSGLAYVMSVRRFRGRHALAFYVYFTMIFTGGIIPWFVTMRMLGLMDTIWALIIPLLVNPWWVFILRNFFKELPEEIIESARLDGASDATILFRIVLPLSLPALATVGLFMAVIYWNDWWHGMMLLNFAKFRPLAVILLRMVQSIRAIEQAIRTGSAMVDVSALPTLSIRMATTVLTIGPIILVYPFVQRYFIRGLMLGGIKG